jgi:nucleoside-diphosphate-sugar epimerase
VADVVDATCRAAVVDVAPGEVLNVAGGVRVELGHAIEELARVCGCPAVLGPGALPAGEMAHTYADGSRAAALLGWRPKTALVDGLREEVRWVEAMERSGGLP